MVGRVWAMNALSADESTANDAVHFMLLVLGRGGGRENRHSHYQDCKCVLFPRRFRSRMRDR